MQLQQIFDSFIIFAAQQTQIGIPAKNVKYSSEACNGTSLVNSTWMQFRPSRIRMAPFPTREYTDDEFQSIVKSVMGLLYVSSSFDVLQFPSYIWNMIEYFSSLYLFKVHFGFSLPDLTPYQLYCI